MLTSELNTSISYTDFLNSFKDTLKTVFYERDNIEKFTQKRGFPALVLRDIMAHNPLSVAIEKKYGGRGAIVKECLGLLSSASYESLPLSLTFGINIALFLEPVGKYGQESAKQKIFSRFLTKQNLGGLMITEPEFGSDALSMQTSNVYKDGKYHIKGIKHWQGLTSLADFWLMTSRPKKESGDLGRDIDFFITDESVPEQRIVVEELFNNIGLYPIPYGRNKVDILVPEENKLIPESTGLKLMMDLLHRSRIQFPGMGMGFIHRMFDEALKHTKERMVGGRNLFALDEIKHALGRMQSAFTISSAMCYKSCTFSGIENNMAPHGVEANAMKAYVSDMMFETSNRLTQLFGAKGYAEESLGARGIVDSRPFQIFEGANEMLYSQLAEMIAKLMTRKKMPNLLEFLSQYNLTEKVSHRFKELVNFNIDAKLPQRKLVVLGRILSRIINAQFVVEMGNSGFRPDLIRDALETLRYDVSMMLSAFKFSTDVNPVEEYQEGSAWLDYCE